MSGQIDALQNRSSRRVRPRAVPGVLVALTLMIAGKASADIPTVVLGPGYGYIGTEYYQQFNRVLSQDTLYVLTGLYYVDSTFTLTIPPGTVIQCDTASALIVRRGARIYAEGDPCRPIAFTSRRYPGNRQPGYWAGVVILGRARANKTEPTISTALTYGRYGGADDFDESGTFEYVRIEYAGYRFDPNDKFNGLTLGGVGRGTGISHVQVSYSSEDAFAFFGGTVNANYLVSFACADDDLYTTFGYRGRIQFFFGLRDEYLSSAEGASRGLESENDGSTVSTDEPYTRPIITNATIVGPERTDAHVPMPPTAAFDFSALIRHSSQLSLYNSVIMGWPWGLSIRDEVTRSFALSGVLQWRNVSIQATLEVVQSSGSVHDETNWPGITAWFDTPGFENLGSSPRLPSDLLMEDLSNLNHPRPIPQPGSELIGTADFSNPRLSGLVFTTYRGAFDPGMEMSEQWTQGWASFDPQVVDYANRVLIVPSADYPDIRTALDATFNGDTVLVQPGTYTGPNNNDLQLGGKYIVLKSSAGAASTTLDCLNVGAGFIINGGLTCPPVIDGFTVRNGLPSAPGLAVRVGPTPSAATIRNCDFTSHSPSSATGAVVLVEAGPPVFENCDLYGNTPSGTGGIIRVTGGSPYFNLCNVTYNNAVRAVQLPGGSPWLETCVLRYNTADVTLNVATGATIANCAVVDNTGYGAQFLNAPPSVVTASDFSRNGSGGVTLQKNSSHFTYCDFNENSGGGFIFASGTLNIVVSPTFQYCYFQGNHPVYSYAAASDSPPGFDARSDVQIDTGGGIRFECTIVDASGRLEPVYNDCTITGNASSGSGGGVYICGQAWSGGVIAPAFTNCTVSANAAGALGGGVYMSIVESSGGQGSAAMDLTILYDNCAYGVEDAGNEAWVSPENELSFGCCDVNVNGVVGTSIIYMDLTSANPAFCEMAFCDTLGTLAGDFSLANYSPAAPASSPCGLRIGAHPVVCGSSVGTGGDDPALPTVTELYQNEPNPFNPVTSIRFDLARSGKVELTIYDVKGRRVRSLVNESLPRGWHEVRWDGVDDRGQSVASGVYFLRLSTAQKVQTRKIVLVK